MTSGCRSPDEREEVEPGDSDGDGPESPLPGLPQARVSAAGGEVKHHQDGRDVAEQVDQVVHLEVPQLGLQIFYKFLSRKILFLKFLEKFKYFNEEPGGADDDDDNFRNCLPFFLLEM